MMKRRFEMDDDGRRGATLGAGNRNCGAAKIRSFSFSLSLSLSFFWVTSASEMLGNGTDATGAIKGRRGRCGGHRSSAGTLSGYCLPGFSSSFAGYFLLLLLLLLWLLLLFSYQLSAPVIDHEVVDRCAGDCSRRHCFHSATAF